MGTIPDTVNPGFAPLEARRTKPAHNTIKSYHALKNIDCGSFPTFRYLRGCTGQSQGELARLLANDATRQQTVESIANSSKHQLPLLLSYARSPPPGVNKHLLDIALAEVFGRLKAKEAIPFLIRNITLQRGSAGPDFLANTAESIKAWMPAITALILIGPDAVRSVIHAVWNLHDRDRIAAIFVISESTNVPEARDALQQIMAQARLEQYWAQQGLERMDQVP